MTRLFGLMVLALLVLLAAPSSYAVQFVAHLDGASENPANASPGTGLARVGLDTVAHTLSVSVTFSGLLFPTSAAHIHCCVSPPNNVGVATPFDPSFPGFPLGVTSGTFTDVFAPPTFRAAFITNFAGGDPLLAEETLLAGLLAGQAYFNIHTQVPGSSPPIGFPGGEIRGFLQPVPEPGTLGLLAVGITALVVAVRRQRG